MNVSNWAFLPLHRIAIAIVLTVVGAIVSTVPASADRPGQPQLKRLAVPVDVVDGVATRLNLRYHESVGVSISPDDSADGGLLILAPPDMHARIAADAASLAESLVRETGATGTASMTRHLVHVSWREIEDAFREVGGDAPVTTSRNGERASFRLPPVSKVSGTTVVEIDRRENIVTMTTKPAMHDAWRTFLTAVDQPLMPGQVMRLQRLTNADFAPIQRAVRLLRDLEPASSRQATRRDRPASTRGQAKFTTAAFPQGGDDATTPAADVAGNNGGGDAAADEATGGVIGDTDIQFIPDSGIIILKGNKRDVQRVRDVIAEIEKQSELTRPEIEIRVLQHADATAVATLLTQLYEDVLSARQGDVSITSLDAPNALLLIGRQEAISAVLDLVQKIDVPVGEADRLRVFRLQHASALDAEETIRDFFTARPGSDDELRGGLGIRVRISADYRTNSLIISASPRDMAEVTRLIGELDVRDIPATSEIKVFSLSNARAEELVDVLTEALTGDPEDNAGDTVPPASTLSIVSLGAEGNPVLDSGILTGAVITADTGANAIVVRAPSAGMALIGELIRQLDQAPGIDSLVKVFTIENGDATQLTTALQNLFGDDAATSGTSVGAANLAGLPALSASESALVPLTFATDIRTNSIIVSGSAEDLEVVESILLRLDSTGFAERITEVIWLKHQIATNIATAITDYVTQRRTGQNVIQQFQQGLGPFDLPDRDLVVVPEAQTNSLLISVSPRLYEEVRRLIDRLDRRPPMVLIKTLIAEVRLDDGFEIGGELGLQDSILFDRGVASQPFNNNFPPSTNAPLPQNVTVAANGTQTISNNVTVEQLNPLQTFLNGVGFNFGGSNLPNANSFRQGNVASRGVTSFGVGASQLGIAGAQGFVFSAASDSVNLLLRTLRTANRLQVLSRPEVMTADNTEGFINVGQSFPRPTEIVLNQFGGTQVGIADVPIGIILRVTPRVGADGLILMRIDATRSDVNFGEGQVIGALDNGEPLFVPAIDQTTAQTTITAFDGQTVVFGGLIQKSRQNTSRRVPYLADIPILGVFFKYEAEIESRSELIIVMTPTLVTGDEDLEYVKQTESSRMSWCLADVVEAHGDVGLSGGYGLWGPAVGPTIYPDIHPTVDVFPAADMPGGPRAIHAGGMFSADPMLDGSTPMVPGVQLAPGESILTPPQTAYPGGPVYDRQPVYDSQPMYDGGMIGSPVNTLPTGALPPPVEISPLPGAGASVSPNLTTPTTRSTSTPAMPASSKKPSGKRWFNFYNK